jgi:hypothetical protein
MPPKKNNKKPEEHEASDDGSDEDAGVVDLSKDPKMIAALQAQLAQLQGRSSGYVDSLGPDVKRRINALKNLQVQHAALSVQYEKEIAALELKFAALNQPLYDKRRQIIGGEVEPTEEEATFAGEESDDEEELDEEEKKQKAAAKEEAAKLAPVKGIPHFWLTALQRSDIVASKIEEHDIPVLEHLTDVSVVHNAEAGTGFTLNFRFSENEFFTDEVLTKNYTIEFGAEEGALMYQGPSFSNAAGCEVHWKAGKNVGVKAIKKKQKKKGSNQTRVVTKYEKQSTFFDFFSPPKAPTDDDENAAESGAALEEDFELGDTIREKVIPHAVLWFTGEALDYEGDDDYEGYDEDGEDGDDDEDEDEDDEEHHGHSHAHGHGHGHAHGAPKAGGAPGQKPECKQA